MTQQSVKLPAACKRPTNPAKHRWKDAWAIRRKAAETLTNPDTQDKEKQI
ncbi:hypothetical protein PO124_30500 [Bacillus licheniformis]|nr:hypothetical protein [Bacillus licheniformis]